MKHLFARSVTAPVIVSLPREAFTIEAGIAVESVVIVAILIVRRVVVLLAIASLPCAEAEETEFALAHLAAHMVAAFEQV